MEPAVLWRRLAALTYDSLLIFGLNILISLIFIAVQVPMPEAGADINQVDPVGINSDLLALLWLLATFAFYGWFWTHGGQTLGMRVWKIKTVLANGQPMTWAASLMRSITALLSLGCLGLGFLWVLIDPAKRAWHDRLSKTAVIVQPLTLKAKK